MPDYEHAIPKITLPNGRTIPQLGFGTLAIQPTRDTDESNIAITAEVVTRALAAGYRHIDTAQNYGTESGVGKAIAESGIPRDELYITSKLSNSHHRPGDVRRSYAETLVNLGIDQLDLFLIHWPLPTLYGGDYVSTWSAMTELVRQGDLRSAGVSNFQRPHLERIVGETGIAPIVNQFELHPYFMNRDSYAACQEFGIAVEAHSPLGHNNAELSDESIAAIAAASNKSVAQVILRWHMHHRFIAIPKSVRSERMVENIDIFDFELTPEEIASIDALDRGDPGRVGPNSMTYEG